MKIVGLLLLTISAAGFTIYARSTLQALYKLAKRKDEKFFERLKTDLIKPGNLTLLSFSNNVSFHDDELKEAYYRTFRIWKFYHVFLYLHFFLAIAVIAWMNFGK